MKKARTLLCPGCGTVFTVVGAPSGRKYCDDCIAEGLNNKDTPKIKSCVYCGKPFRPSRHNYSYCPDCTKKFEGRKIREISKRYINLAKSCGIDVEGKCIEELQKLLTAKCKVCGNEFIKKSKNDEYCQDCRKRLGRKLQIMKQNEEKKKTVIITPVYKTPKYTINDIVNRARQAGLSYGEYVARYHI